MSTKQRLEVGPRTAPGVGLVGAPSGVKVVDAKPGAVTVLDKAKGYYKGLIALVGFVLAVLTQVTPVVPQDWKSFISTGIGALTVAATILKANEHWFDDL